MNVGLTAKVFAAAILQVGLALSSASAQNDKNRAIEQYTCKDIMRESGASRDVAIAFLPRISPRQVRQHEIQS